MRSQLSAEVLGRIEKSGVVAVLVIDEVRHAVPLARALARGGVDIMELTLRTPAAIDALKAIRGEVPEMLAGIGTILTTQQVDAVHAAGASFGVAPGVNPRVIRRAQEVGLPFSPGIATPTDIEMALELGCRELKFFPAEPSGGLRYLQSIAAPYVHLGVRFLPLGGLNAANMCSYLADKLILAIGGSWLAPRDVVAAEKWDLIQATAAAARKAIDDFRASPR